MPPRHATRFQIVHVTLFTIGVVVSFFGVVLWIPTALVVGGVGLAAAGALTVAGWRIALRGALGDVFRHVLGSATIRRAEIVGVLWVVVGAALAALGVTLLSAEPQAPTEPIHHARVTVEPQRADTDPGAASWMQASGAARRRIVDPAGGRPPPRAAY